MGCLKESSWIEDFSWQSYKKACSASFRRRRVAGTGSKSWFLFVNFEFMSLLLFANGTDEFVAESRSRSVKILCSFCIGTKAKIFVLSSKAIDLQT